MCMYQPYGGFVKKHLDCKHFAQSLIMLGLLSELLLFLRATWILEDLWCTSLLFMIPQGYWAGDLWYTVHSNSASNMFVSPNKICRVVEALLVPLSILMIYLVLWFGKILHVPTSLYVSFAWYYFSSILPVSGSLSVGMSEWATSGISYHLSPTRFWLSLPTKSLG